MLPEMPGQGVRKDSDHWGEAFTPGELSEFFQVGRVLE